MNNCQCKCHKDGAILCSICYQNYKDWDKISPEQKNFMAFVNKTLTNKKAVMELEKTIHDLIYDFTDRLLKDPTVLEDMQMKMKRGSKEHGSPIMSIKNINEEIYCEIMDCFIWRLLRSWNEEKINAPKT